MSNQKSEGSTLPSYHSGSRITEAINGGYPFYDAVITKLQGLLQQRRKDREAYRSNQATNSKQVILVGNDRLLTFHWPRKIGVTPNFNEDRKR